MQSSDWNVNIYDCFRVRLCGLNQAAIRGVSVSFSWIHLHRSCFFLTGPHSYIYLCPIYYVVLFELLNVCNVHVCMHVCMQTYMFALIYIWMHVWDGEKKDKRYGRLRFYMATNSRCQCCTVVEQATWILAYLSGVLLFKVHSVTQSIGMCLFNYDCLIFRKQTISVTYIQVFAHYMYRLLNKL